MCAQEHSGGSSRRCADRDVLAVLPTCAKIAPVEHLHTAISQLTRTEGKSPRNRWSTGRWTLLEWERLRSTNSLAMQALKALPTAGWDHIGLTAAEQTEGRGQQQRSWSQNTPEDLVLTLVLSKGLPAPHPFTLNLAVSLAVLEAIEASIPNLRSDGLKVKWPNDIMWKGKKAGGILIENNWRGNKWSSAVIGIGLNLSGAPSYPSATQLISADHGLIGASELRAALLKAIPLNLDARMAELAHPEALLQKYHQRLLGWGMAQRWQLDGTEVRGVLESIDLDGRLCVLENEVGRCFSPGEVGWLGMEPH